MQTSKKLTFALASLLVLPLGIPAASPLAITEFMASNTHSLADENGEYSDWIEIYNAGTNTVALAGWSLTDSGGNLTKWRFPATNLNAGGYLVVFASSKNRRAPGAPLHTNFRLDGSGEYLALVEPDGVTKASEFAPVFPPQVPDVSFGLGQTMVPLPLITNTSAVRYQVPASSGLESVWNRSDYSDDAWAEGTNGVGFESVPGEPGQTPYGALIATEVQGPMQGQNASIYLRFPFEVPDPTAIKNLNLRMRYDDGFVAFLNGVEAVSRNAPVGGPLADSVTEFSGSQGLNNWYYGYYDRSADGDGVYQVTNFIAFADTQWTGSLWDLSAANPPWTSMDANGGHPNGSNSGNVHWTMRRWQSEVSGNVLVTIRLAKSNVGGGNGTTMRFFHNGVQKSAYAVAGTDGTGITTNINLMGIAAGDYLDFALDPAGADGLSTDSYDGSILTVHIEGTSSLTWNSTATLAHPNSQGREFQEFDLFGLVRWLTAGTNVLAIQGLNLHATNADFLIQAELDGIIPGSVLADVRRYFTLSSPGAPNGIGAADLGPIITEVTHAPAEPSGEEDLVVTARIAPAFAPLASNSLVYRVMFSNEVSLPLLDDGLHGDGTAGDGVFGGIIPAAAAEPGQMIRYFVSSLDVSNRISRWPMYPDPASSPQYLGTVVRDPTLTNPLPVLHWFLQNKAAADTDAGTRCSLFYDGVFYDNVFVNIHGQSSRGFPKKSYDLEFNPGYKFRYDPAREPVGDINFMTTYPDKAHLRNILAYETYRDAGSPHHFVYTVRVQTNGVFYGDAHLMENGDGEYLERNGLDPNGALYKMYNTFNSSPAHAAIGSGVAEKKTRKYEGNADLLALLNGVLLTGAPRTAYLYDNVDLPEVVNFLAARIITADRDCCHKNYYLYRDTVGTGEWQALAWDVDLSFGRSWITGLTYWDDTVTWNNRLLIGDNNGLFAAMFNTPEIRQMYLRRIRTLMEELLQPPETPLHQLRYETRIYSLLPYLAPDAALDLAKWGTWGNGAAQSTCCIQTLPHAVDIILTNFFPLRRQALFTKAASIQYANELPNAQPANASLLVDQAEFNPTSGNQAQEFLRLTNFNSFAVDISGWTLSGAIEHRFKPGTVIPAGRTLYVSPDVKAFRARTASPRGGESLFVQGNYQGQLSARGETVRLLDTFGRLVHAYVYAGDPSPAQQSLRVTEIMYHPSPLAGNTNDVDAFEFIELKNIGAAALDLTGVRFTDGIEFDFTGAVITNLAAGQTVLLVKDLAAFAARYGAGQPVAGQYVGNLDNAGERLRLVDATGEEILDFTYQDGWYPSTDGLGFSLVVVDAHAPPDAWNNRSQWRPSGVASGSPGIDEAPPTPPLPVLITEALSRTDVPPPTDSIELFNPHAVPVNIGGWFLTDDFGTPHKFRIPDGTTIQSNAFLVFTEADFNPGGVGFALSADGDEVYLFSADAGGTLTGYHHGFKFGAAEDGISFGRHVISTGEERFVAQSVRTLGDHNAGPRVGPVVINEIHYHPPNLPDNSAVVASTDYPETFSNPTTDNSADEFIELLNLSAEPVLLAEAVDSTNVWKLTGGVDFVFPPNLTLAAGEFVLLVNFAAANPALAADFRARLGVPEAVRLFGPYSGKLSNVSDDVELKKPATPRPGQPVPYVLVDKVDYQDASPWAAAADGLGYSLQRWTANAYGNDPAHWIAAVPTPGTSTLTQVAAPSFTAQPVSRYAAVGQDITFSAVVTGGEPLLFQWLFNGMNLPDATNTTLLLTNVQPAQIGDYQLLAVNAAGAVLSERASLSMQFPIAFYQQPASIKVAVPPDPAALPSTNATFTVGAFSATPVQYQWYNNGRLIPGATNTSYTVVGVKTNDLGTFTVAVTDGEGTTISPPAWLYPVVRIQALQGPLSQTVPVGSLVTLSAEFVGWPPPFTCEWRRVQVVLATNVQDHLSTFFAITMPNVVTTHQYRAVVRNVAYPGGVGSSFATITTLADADGDGVPDEWETKYGFDSGSPLDAQGDADNDSVSNGDEYLAGTDPTNALSYLKIDRISSGAATATLEFFAVSNRTYTVEYREALANADWLALRNVAARSTNHVEFIHDPSPSTNRFYRLRTPVRP